MDIHQTKLWMLTDCNCCGELMKVPIDEGLESLSNLHRQHVESSPTCKAYFDGLPTLSEICKQFQEAREANPKPPLTMADFEPALPLRRMLSPLVEDANGRLVMACDCCGKLYTDRIDEEPWFVCPCGRLGQRMDEATVEQCGLGAAPE